MRYRVDEAGTSELPRRVPGRRLSRRRSVALLMPAAASIVIVSTACQKHDPPAQPQKAAQSFARGDRVVVEIRGAEFFEGRVLFSDKTSLRIEPEDRRPPVTIAVADAYRLPPSATPFRVGQLAICLAEGRWLGCRIQSTSGAQLGSETLDGKHHHLSPTAVLAASPMTDLNLKQAFARSFARQQFRQAAERAGSPQAPPGSRLLPRARVVARRGTGWYGGVVQELEDETTRIEFSSDAQRESLESAHIVPEPPYPTLPARGDFALVRPDSPSNPWEAVRVVGTTDRQFRVVSIDGVERLVTARDLLPLTPP